MCCLYLIDFIIFNIVTIIFAILLHTILIVLMLEYLK